MLTTDDSLQIKGSLLSNEKAVKLLGKTVEDKVSFEPHLNEVCKTVSQKNHAPTRVCKFIPLKKAESHYESIYSISIFLLLLGLDMP